MPNGGQINLMTLLNIIVLTLFKLSLADVERTATISLTPSSASTVSSQTYESTGLGFQWSESHWSKGCENIHSKTSYTTTGGSGTDF